MGGQNTCVRFAQIAGLIARRIVFYKKPGDTVAKGERIGLIKFGSRVDVFLGPEWEIKVRTGQRVAGGSSILARTKDGLMARLTFKQRFFEGRPPSQRPRRAAYALPTLFTAGNIFLGFLAILRSIEGALLGASGQLGANPHFEVAAKAIGAAVVLDGLDGRIARMTNTVSAFGREMDSLADVITLRHCAGGPGLRLGRAVRHARRIPAGSSRRLLLRVPFSAVRRGAAGALQRPGESDPEESRPRRTANISSGFRFRPRRAWWPPSSTPPTACRSNGGSIRVLWLALLALLSFLMVSTWRYPSFKEINLKGPRSPLTVVLFGAIIYMIWNYSQPVLLALATLYVSTGIVIRAAGIIRRRFRPHPPPPQPEHQAELMHSHRSSQRARIAIVGGDSLLGKETHQTAGIAQAGREGRSDLIL